ncbi:MAG: LysM peptidoglycan-binding domain-containing protein [Akkermansiaceae bacterium]|nr:LysM peptidoglycan-binding domain-containing protein [Akkermansiaceae bacterium]
MKPVIWISASCALVMALASCTNFGGGPGFGTTGSQQAGTGPFDENGNYVEAWADNPSKWRKSGGARSPHELGTDEIPKIAKSEQPPQNSIPLYPSTLFARSKSSGAKPKVELAKAAAAKSSVKSATKTAEKSSAKTTGKSTTAKASPAKSPTKSTRYVIKQGDSLSSIASRMGCSVAALKSANGISGTAIRAGRSLTIPRK